MTEATVSMDVRSPESAVSVIDISGEITAACEPTLMEAYGRASGNGYMNSSGIGLLVTLLVRANRNRQRLMAFGLSDHYRQIFELTRLDEAIGIHDDEAAALAAAG
jgi:anti-sigma B factor antagonist